MKQNMSTDEKGITSSRSYILWLFLMLLLIYPLSRSLLFQCVQYASKLFSQLDQKRRRRYFPTPLHYLQSNSVIVFGPAL